jgi:putative hydrolase of the HAD superfamily
MLQPIRNIIFDLGGVLINIDYQRTAKAFRKLGLNNFEEIYSQAKQEKLFDMLETGHLHEDHFREELMRNLPSGINHSDVDNAWNAMLLDFPLSRLEFIYKLRNNYRIFLLSNTNIIHVNAFLMLADEQVGKTRFENAFEKIYYSCDIGLRKPDPSIFELVLQENNLRASETLFVDDSPQHIDGAKLSGIQAELLLPGESIELKYAGLLMSS